MNDRWQRKEKVNSQEHLAVQIFLIVEIAYQNLKSYLTCSQIGNFAYLAISLIGFLWYLWFCEVFVLRITDYAR